MCPLSVVFSNSDQILGCLPGLITAMGIYILEGINPRIMKKPGEDYEGIWKLQRNNSDVVGL